ncbi:DnaA regulatory inactivator Hda, partial [Amnimonas aquatica]
MPPEFALTPAMPEEQLLLPLQGRSDITLADLPARAFAPVLSALAQLRAGQLGEVCIWGAPGAGRSLLLSAFVSDVARDAGQAVLLPLRQVVFMPPEMLDGLESCPLIVLDDIEAVAGWPAWEEGLFNLYNRLQASGGRLLFSACTPPSGLPLQLPDLRSRLARASAHALPAPDDDVL